MLGVPAAAVRVVSGDVGGNFGIRNNTCPEFALVAWAARRVGRPVKWLCERRDAFATDFHRRDLTSQAELALDKEGRFLALRAVNTSNLGASAISFVPLAKGIAVSSSVYDIPCSYMRGRAVVTNTAPTSAYRSAGRPEVVFVLERLIDIACHRYRFDRLQIRRRIAGRRSPAARKSTIAPPPSPEDCGSTTPRTIWIATAASTAVPPLASICIPLAVASGLAVATAYCALLAARSFSAAYA